MSVGQQLSTHRCSKGSSSVAHLFQQQFGVVSFLCTHKLIFAPSSLMLDQLPKDRLLLCVIKVLLICLLQLITRVFGCYWIWLIIINTSWQVQVTKCLVQTNHKFKVYSYVCTCFYLSLLGNSLGSLVNTHRWLARVLEVYSFNNSNALELPRYAVELSTFSC